jgi:predicted metal-dependent phosphoesterase TrpH
MRIDLHIHTTAYSPCATMTPDELMIAAKAAELDAICITEHNRLWKPEEAQALSEKYDLPVFRGIEITTTGGDILVFGLDDEPGDAMWTPADLKEKVDKASAVAIAAHPFRGFLLFGFGALNMDLEAAMDNPTFKQVHGLEICNGRVTAEENGQAKQVAEAMGLLQTGGSDAHDKKEVGKCVTVFDNPIKTEAELIQALLKGAFHVEQS